MLTDGSWDAEPRHLFGRDEGFPVVKEANRDLSVGIRPSEDVGEAKVAEGVLCVGSEEAELSAAQHHAEPESNRNLHDPVRAKAAVLRHTGSSYGLWGEDADAVKFAVVSPDFEKARELVGGRDHVPGGDDARQEAGIVGQCDRL